ncbi:MAG: hypothetical protein NWT08_10685 [Akkermansiaceae bacterium]|jgi:hypothetical protein|nr:hypothetical protein [Akkermansiaceae bacterium]MDP4647270.1 hypothetical protein [Akkermansiaceae bacterium]MDP4722504.1 hypothetical protein [Akkermansiaceae bacterium]MDP4781050.1 hypothetical protein [Akkermansiaceae bacterium]MDP4848516.1 hypothetical protein [Akkermansiaceae bacterium]
MKIPIAILMLAVSCHAQEDASVVRFSNGDQLTGEVLGLSVEKLTWQSQILKEPAEFDIRYVMDLNMPSGVEKPEKAGAAHEATLEMTNGDSIQGALIGLTNEEIRLDTWYAGEMVFRRVNVKSVKITQASDYFYRGPNSLDEWTLTDESAWTFKAGVLQSLSTGGAAREIGFPDEFSIAFDATWRGAFRPRIVFLSTDVEGNNPKGGYEMVFQGNSVHVKKGGSNAWLGHTTNAGQLRENEKAHIEIKASTKTGKILLYVDGEMVDIWEDNEVDKESIGKGFHFIAQDRSPLKISNIEVTSWDGNYDEVPNQRRGAMRFGGGIDFGDEEEVEEKKDVVPEGRMVLRNGDTIEGEVTGIEGEEITLKTPLSEVKFPVSRLKNIILKEADMETPKRNRGDVRATLSDGTRLVFRLDGVEDGKILGFSQNFGDAEFLKGAFKRIEFNIYDRNMEKMRLDKEW